ncbi:hypothetical protein C0992_010832 [Termitomyces sp. T32_za158]|nr:hypothetical protein C0992_010832 [Termitomyces sp. T32_za158]
MASALNTFYTRRGFVLLNKKGAPIQDAFRRGLGYAAQWYDNLQIRLAHHVEATILKSDTQIQEQKDLFHPTAPSELIPHPVSIDTPHPPSLTPGECARLLQQRCPACFGGNLFGRPLKEEYAAFSILQISVICSDIISVEVTFTSALTAISIIDISDLQEIVPNFTTLSLFSPKTMLIA